MADAQAGSEGNPFGPVGDAGKFLFGGLRGQTNYNPAIGAKQDPLRGIGTPQLEQGFANQGALAQQFGNIASGQAPSQADAQARIARGELAGSTASLARSGIGANRGLAGRSAFMANAQGQQGIGAQAMAQRIAEQQGAMNSQANLYGQIQQGALGTTNAGITSEGQRLDAAAKEQELRTKIAQQNAENDRGFLGSIATTIGTAFGGGGKK